MKQTVNDVCRRCGSWYFKKNILECGCYCPACRKAVAEERRQKKLNHKSN